MHGRFMHFAGILQMGEMFAGNVLRHLRTCRERAEG